MWLKTHIFSMCFLPRPSTKLKKCGGRPTFFQFVFLASAFGHARQMWPKAHIHSTDYHTQAFGHAGQMWPKAYIFASAHIISNMFFRFGLRPRRTDVAEGQHYFK